MRRISAPGEASCGDAARRGDPGSRGAVAFSCAGAVIQPASAREAHAVGCHVDDRIAQAVGAIENNGPLRAFVPVSGIVNIDASAGTQ